MKKLLLFVSVMLISTAMFAQNRATYLQESFDGAQIPTGWSIAEMGQSNWSVSETNNAGNSANEMLLYYNPSFNGTSRLVTPEIDLSGLSSVVFQFKHCLDNYSGSHTLGIATSSDGGATWNSGWTQNYGTDGVYTITQNISTPDIGNSNVKFCIYYTGNSYNIDNWYFDDVEIFSMENLDASMNQIISSENVGSGPQTVGFVVSNKGETEITSIEVSYQFSGYEAVTETFTNNIASLSSATLTFDQQTSIVPGFYELTVEILSVNGQIDDDETNNSGSMTVSAALSATQRLPMIEHFSSSTCGPCVSVNQQMLNLLNNNPGKFTISKYQMSWPSPGDPYYTEEGGTRRTYYGCNAVPQVFMDGVDQGYAAVTAGNFATEYARPAFAEVRGSFNLDGSTITAKVDVMSYIQMENFRVFMIVNEKVTHNNVGGNGETEFHHVMMKMLPDAEGTTVSIPMGDYVTMEYSFDMSSTNVEELEDLEVSAFIQNYSTKEIFNSHFLYEYTDEFPYAPSDLTLEVEDNVLTANWTAPESGNPIGYDLYINGEIVLENTTETSYTMTGEEGALLIVSVKANYADDKNSVPLIKTVELGYVSVNEIANNMISVYPNPANNLLNVVGNNITSIRVYNGVGQLVEIITEGTSINTTNYKSGIYFIDVVADGFTSKQKVVIVH